jgi:hypothetical protein
VNLSSLTEKDHAPHTTLVIPPSVFAEDWQDRPSDDTCVGLRLLSEQDVVFARGEAAKLAVTIEDEESRYETYNDALMRNVVARAMCDPNDVRETYFRMDDVAMVALTPEGTRHLFDAYESMRIARSPVQAEATDEDIAGLAELAATALPLMTPARASRVRRLLSFVVQEMGEAVDGN